jgi:hypothetical protein
LLISGVIQVSQESTQLKKFQSISWKMRTTHSSILAKTNAPTKKFWNSGLATNYVTILNGKAYYFFSVCGHDANKDIKGEYYENGKPIQRNRSSVRPMSKM